MPLNTRLTSPELDWQLKHTETTWLIYDADNADKAKILKGNGQSEEFAKTVPAQMAFFHKLLDMLWS